MIEQAQAETQAQVVLVGMDQALLREPGPALAATTATSPADPQLMRREKADPIDCAAIGDLRRCGEGPADQPLTGIYLQLQQLDRVRLSKVKLETMLTLGHWSDPAEMVQVFKAQPRSLPGLNKRSCQTLIW